VRSTPHCIHCRRLRPYRHTSPPARLSVCWRRTWHISFFSMRTAPPPALPPCLLCTLPNMRTFTPYIHLAPPSPLSKITQLSLLHRTIRDPPVFLLLPYGTLYVYICCLKHGQRSAKRKRVVQRLGRHRTLWLSTAALLLPTLGRQDGRHLACQYRLAPGLRYSLFGTQVASLILLYRVIFALVAVWFWTRPAGCWQAVNSVEQRPWHDRRDDGRPEQPQTHSL